MSADEAVRHLLHARRHLSLAVDAALPEQLRARRAELRTQCRAALRVLVEEATRAASDDDAPTEPTRPTRVTVE